MVWFTGVLVVLHVACVSGLCYLLLFAFALSALWFTACLLLLLVCAPLVSDLCFPVLVALL